MKTLLLASFMLIISTIAATSQTTLTPVWTRAGLPSSYSSMNFTPDGKYLVSGGYYEQSVKLWDARTGKPYWAFAINGYSSSQTYSADGNIIMATGSDGTVQVADIAVKTVIFRQAAAQYSVLSPDGRHCYTVISGRLVRMWDVRTGALLREFTVNADNYSMPVVTGDGRRLLFRGADRRVYIHDAETGALLRSFLNGPYAPTALYATPDGRYCLTSGSDLQLKVWSLDSAAAVAKFPAPAYLTAVQFTADGKTLAVAGYDSTLTFYSTTDWAKIRTQKFAGQPAFTLHPNSKQYVINDNDYVKYYDIATGVYSLAIKIDKRVVYSRVSPDGGRLVTSAGDSVIQMRVSPEWEVAYEIIGHRSRIAALGYSADGAKLYSAEASGFVFTNNAANGAILAGATYAVHCNQPDATADQSTRTVALRADSNRLFLGSGCTYRDPNNATHYLQNINCYNLITGEAEYAMDAETESYNVNGTPALRYSPISRMIVNNNGKYLATVGIADANIGVWNTDLRELRKRIGAHDYGFRGYNFSDNGEYIITTSFQEVKLWDTPTGSLQNVVTGMADWVDAAAVSGKNNLIATQSGAEVTVWDAVTEMPYRRFWLDTTVAGALLFSPNGRYLLFSGRNLRIWHLSSMADVGISGVLGLGAASATAPLQAAFSPDSKFLAAGSSDGSITVFSLGELISGYDESFGNAGLPEIFPQPADNVASLRLSEEFVGDEIGVQISDNTGRVVYETTLQGGANDGLFHIPTRQLPNGAYHCRVKAKLIQTVVPLMVVHF